MQITRDNDSQYANMRGWSFPVISAALFLIGTWIFFDIGETAFIMYAAVYLALGTAVMLISMFVRKKMQK